MSLSHYPKNIDSGLKWLGSIPVHWNVVRFKQVFQERDLRSKEGSETLLSVSAYTGVSPRSEIVSDGDFLTRAESLVGYKICCPGDLVINIMLAWNKGLGVSPHFGIVSPAYCVFAIMDGYIPKFIDYLVRTDKVNLYFKSYSSGVIDSRLRLYPDVFLSLHCAMPPREEQQAIVSFLDRETAKIDKLISEEEKLIALLAEKRRATISHAVTKGLNPNVAMRDSGVAWFGKVPEHWSLTRLKYAMSHIIDCPHDTPVYTDEGSYYAVRTADITLGRFHIESMYRVDEVEYVKRIRRLAVRKNDIVYSREGERWGFAALVTEDELFCLGQRMMQFRAKITVSSKFMMWQLNAVSTYRQGQIDTVGATSPHVNVGTIRNYLLTEPPLHEQLAIASFLSDETERLDMLANKASRGIKLLTERRNALISAAVTGKIDVRQAVQQEQATLQEAA